MKRKLAVLFMIASFLLIVVVPFPDQNPISMYQLSDHHGG